MDPKTHAGIVTVAPVDTDHQLRAGMQTMLRITSVTADALVVPRDAVLGSIMPGSTATVITVDDDQTDRKSVQLAAINDQYVQVASGLAPGELVAIGNLNNLISGQPVTVTPLTAEVPNAQ